MTYLLLIVCSLVILLGVIYFNLHFGGIIRELFGLNHDEIKEDTILFPRL